MQPNRAMNATNRKSWLRVHRKKLLAILACLVAAVVFISCSTISRTMMAPPQIPGAEFVGSKSCAECHAEIARDFQTATHARLKAEGNNAKDIGS